MMRPLFLCSVAGLLCAVGCVETPEKSDDGGAGTTTVEDSGGLGDDGGSGDTASGASGGDGSGDSGGDGSGDSGGEGSGDSGGEGSGDSGGEGSGDSGGDGTGDAGDDGTTEEPPALPVEGSWSLSSFDLTRDDCGVASFQDVSEFVAETYVVAHVDDTTFSLAADGGAPDNCTVTDGEAFTCPPLEVREDLSSVGFDAEMVVDTVFSGTLDGGYLEMTGVTDITVECEGDCFLIEFVLDFPCPMAIDMTLSAD